MDVHYALSSSSAFGGPAKEPPLSGLIFAFRKKVLVYIASACMDRSMLGSKLARYACGAPLTAKVFTYSVNSFALGTRPRMFLSHALCLIGPNIKGAYRHKTAKVSTLKTYQGTYWYLSWYLSIIVSNWCYIQYKLGWPLCI